MKNEASKVYSSFHIFLSPVKQVFPDKRILLKINVQTNEKHPV
jgi:hypothetical protein